MKDRREYQKNYAKTDRGKAARRKARQRYEQSLQGRLAQLKRRFQIKQAQRKQAALRDKLQIRSMQAKQQKLQARIRAAIDGGRLTAYSVRDGLYFPIVNHVVATDPAIIEEILHDHNA